MEDLQQKLPLLWQRYLDGKTSREELTELMDVLENLPVTQETDKLMQLVERELESSWEQADTTISPVNQYDWKRSWYAINKRTQRSSVLVQFTRRYWPAAAAAVLFAFSIWYFQQEKSPSVREIAKAPETKMIRLANRTVYLPDGTMVVLKGNASLKEETFNDRQRIVSIVGEAFFDVKHDAQRPFYVKAQEVSIRVLGTAFLVSAIPGKNVSVKVTRGKVEVSREQQIISVLTPAQAIDFDLVQQTHSVNLQADTTAVMEEKKIQEWRWSDAPISEVIAWLEKHYHVKIEVQDASVQQSRFTASFREPVSLEDILEVIQELYHIKLTITQKNTDGSS